MTASTSSSLQGESLKEKLSRFGVRLESSTIGRRVKKVRLSVCFFFVGLRVVLFNLRCSTRVPFILQLKDKMPKPVAVKEESGIQWNPSNVLPTCSKVCLV